MNHPFLVFLICACLANLALARLNYRELRRLLRSHREFRAHRDAHLAAIAGARKLCEREIERLQTTMRTFDTERATLETIAARERAYLADRKACGR